jgi:hypothetical protein
MLSNKKYCLLIEPRAEGHHFAYIEGLINQFQFLGYECIVTTQGNSEGELLEELIRERISDKIEIFKYGEININNNSNSIFQLAVSEIIVRNYYKKVYKYISKSINIELVFIPYFDEMLFAFSLLGSPFENTRFSGITMRQRFHFVNQTDTFSSRLINWIKYRLFLKLLSQKKLNKLFSIDPTLKNFKKVNEYPKLKYLPDPVTKMKNGRVQITKESLGVKKSDFLVLVYGYLEKRKGFIKLFEWASLNSNISPIKLLLVGKQDKWIEDLIRATKNNSKLQIIEVNRFIHEDEEYGYFSVADSIWLAYENFHLMSSVLVKASQLSKQIIYHPVGLINYFAEIYAEDIIETDLTSKFEFASLSLSVKKFGIKGQELSTNHTWGNFFQLFN